MICSIVVRITCSIVTWLTFLPGVRPTCSPVTHPISSTVILPICSPVRRPTCSQVPRPICSPVTWPTCSLVNLTGEYVSLVPVIRHLIQYRRSKKGYFKTWDSPLGYPYILVFGQVKDFLSR